MFSHFLPGNLHFLFQFPGGHSQHTGAQGRNLHQCVGGGHPNPVLLLQAIAGLFDVHIRRLRLLGVDNTDAVALLHAAGIALDLVGVKDQNDFALFCAAVVDQHIPPATAQRLHGVHVGRMGRHHAAEILAHSVIAVETAVFTRDLNTYSVNLQAKSYDGTILGSGFENSSERIYDMLSMLSYARSLNSDGIDVGHTVTLPMVNGTQVVRQYIVYEGNKSVKADNGTTYNCLVLSIRDKKYGEERETLKAYVTADKEHLPIQLNIKLGVGYIKALYRE